MKIERSRIWRHPDIDSTMEGGMEFSRTWACCKLYTSSRPRLVPLLLTHPNSFIKHFQNITTTNWNVTIGDQGEADLKVTMNGTWPRLWKQFQHRNPLPPPHAGTEKNIKDSNQGRFKFVFPRASSSSSSSSSPQSLWDYHFLSLSFNSAFLQTPRSTCHCRHPLAWVVGAMDSDVYRWNKWFGKLMGMTWITQNT